jgi:hypothetical protein
VAFVWAQFEFAAPMKWFGPNVSESGLNFKKSSNFTQNLGESKVDIGP